jgi:hypothetical protein
MIAAFFIAEYWQIGNLFIATGAISEYTEFE